MLMGKGSKKQKLIVRLLAFQLFFGLLTFGFFGQTSNSPERDIAQFFLHQIPHKAIKSSNDYIRKAKQQGMSQKYLAMAHYFIARNCFNTGLFLYIEYNLRQVFYYDPLFSYSEPDSEFELIVKTIKKNVNGPGKKNVGPGQFIQEQKPTTEPVINNPLLKEKINITNFEVQVRVFLGHKMVRGLRKHDFELWVNNKRKIVNGFTCRISSIKNFAPVVRKSWEPGRLFVLVFKTSSYGLNLKKTLYFFCQQVLSANDRLMVIINNKILNFDKLDNRQQAAVQIEELLRTQSNVAKKEMIQYFNRVRTRLDITKFRLTLKNSNNLSREKDYILNFLTNYLRIIKDFKREVLYPDLNRFFYFAEKIRPWTQKKWVINFYETPVFLYLANSSEIKRQIRSLVGELRSSASASLSGENNAYSKIITNLLGSIENEFNYSDNFPKDILDKIFLSQAVTFHTIMFKTEIQLSSKDFKLKAVTSDLENCFRRLTEITGGDFVFSNNTLQSLQKVNNKEDVVYSLTYRPTFIPEGGINTDDIKIKLSNPRYKAIYNNKEVKEYIKNYLGRMSKKIPDIRIDTLSFNNKTVVIKVSGLQMVKQNNQDEGLANIRIRIRDEKADFVYDKNRDLKVIRDPLQVSIPFGFLKKGFYDLMVDVVDKNSKKNDFRHLRIKI